MAATKRTRLKGEERRALILEAARRVFLESGFAGARTASMITTSRTAAPFDGSQGSHAAILYGGIQIALGGSAPRGPPKAPSWSDESRRPWPA